MPNNIVSVLLNAEEIGQLYWDEKSHRAVFSYNTAFVKSGLDLAPLPAAVQG